MKPYDADEHVKAVYAHFGLAVYFAQVLEHALVNGLVFIDLIPKRAGNPVPKQQWYKEFDSFMDRHFETTLGKMIRSLKAVVSVPPDLEVSLSDALKKRNFLAHDYFRERATEFMIKTGRDEMIAELEDARELFDAAGKKLDEVVKPLREQFGFTDEGFAKYFEEYKAKIGADI